MTAPVDDRQFCPRCQAPRVVLYGPYGALRCMVCGARFTLGDSVKAAQDHARQTVADVAARQVPR